jgi:tetratricopeptide (TPR) repeat protein
LSGFEGIISNYEEQGKLKECPVYSQAGIAAYNLGDLTKALDYLQKAVNTSFADEQTYITMAHAYRNIDNLSLEIETLEKFVEKYPESIESMPMKIRLFETYVESENWQQAYDLWPQIASRVKEDIKYVEDYYFVNRALGNREKADELASKILEEREYRPPDDVRRTLERGHCRDSHRQPYCRGGRRDEGPGGTVPSGGPQRRHRQPAAFRSRRARSIPRVLARSGRRLQQVHRRTD